MLLASLAAIAVGNRNEPFQLTRPPREADHGGKEQPAGGRRLWEDPFLHCPPAPEVDTPAPSPAAKTICVTLDAENTPDARELRRRTRYAVHAAMTAHDYKAVDAGSLNYQFVDERRLPYEDFVSDRPPGLAPGGPKPSSPEQPAKEPIRVYWIDENAFSSEGPPGTRLLPNLIGTHVLDASEAFVIGPTTSSAFACMDRDFACAPGPMTLFSPSATRYESSWRTPNGGAVYERKWPSNGDPRLSVFRLIPDDRLVARTLVSELAQRGISWDAVPTQDDAGERAQANRLRSSRVLLVIERDSDFARAWKTYLEDAWKDVFVEQWPQKRQTQEEKDECARLEAAEPRFEIAYFSRGLDGLPREDDEQKQVATIESPEGRATLDYLRRLCGQLASRQIAAVGVFGQDVHDKLVVLQALRPLLSEAVFFTNDLDSYFGHPRTIKYTRNLIVGSAFDLLPRCASGHHVTPFRNQYQTAMYEAVGRALEPKGNEGRRPKPPILFEIGVTRPRQLEPIDPKMAVSPGGDASHALGLRGSTVIVLVAILLVVGAAQVKKLLRRFIDLRWLRRILWLAFLLPVAVAATVTIRHGLAAWTQEPFEWADGISVWPTEILRVVAYYLSLTFGVGLLRCLRSDYRTIETRFEVESLWGLRLPFQGIGERVDRMVRGILWRQRNVQPGSRAVAGRLGRRIDGWLENLFGRPRLGVHAASALLIAILFFGSVYALMSSSGLPLVPARGGLARSFDFCAMIGSVLAMLWLLFLVAGTNVRIAYLIKRAEGPAIELKEPLPRRFGEPDKDLVGRLRLLESIADLGGACIYGPFIVMLVMIVSRWKGFDDWSWPPLLISVVVLSVLIALTSAFILTAAARAYRRETVRLVDWRLREAAEEPRSKALEHLRAGVLGIDTGVFAGLGGHPAFRALLIPASGLGGLSLLPLLT